MKCSIIEVRMEALHLFDKKITNILTLNVNIGRIILENFKTTLGLQGKER